MKRSLIVMLLVSGLMLSGCMAGVGVSPNNSNSSNVRPYVGVGVIGW